jgi:peptide/nickel transport system ATP-binding protein
MTDSPRSTHEGAGAAAAGAAVLDIRGLSVHFQTREGALHVLRDVSLRIGPGETLGLAGESGSGKTTLGYAIMRALPPAARVGAGEIRFRGADLLAAAPEALRRIRGRRIAMVYQDPRSALNPSMRIGAQIAEVLEIHEGLPRHVAAARATALLEMVHIPDPAAAARAYPHQLSGGMQQRAVIAMGLAGGPDLLIMDEPTTGLDVTTQARILELVGELKRRVGAAILYISHDLAVIAQVSDRVVILYAGEVAEQAPAAAIFARPAHPYTAGLLDALPELDGLRGLRPIEGRMPSVRRIPAGCVFAPRCRFAEPACTAAPPALAEVAPGHLARCWRTAEAQEARAREMSYRPGAPQRARAQGLRDAGGKAGPIVAVEQVVKDYGAAAGLLLRLGLAPPPLRAVAGVSFEVGRDEVLALVGESGCGKSTLGRLVVRLTPLTAGAVRLLDPAGAEVADEAAFRRAVQIVFQHPDSSLNPMKRVGRALARPLALAGLSRPARRRRVAELLEAVRLDPSYAGRLPRELSGGEKQRVAIARALAPGPEFLVLDEPVSALDVSTQASVIRLLGDLRAALGASYLLISHDLSLVRHVAHRVGVMYLGVLVELGAVEEIFRPPSHPYTRALLSAVPRPDPSAPPSAIRLQGQVPSARRPPAGCRFHTRCPEKLGAICEREAPPLQRASDTHWIACHIPLDDLRGAPPVLGPTPAAADALARRDTDPRARAAPEA